MKIMRKILLVFELIIGFGLLLNFWLLGLIMSPSLLVHLAGGDVEAFWVFITFILGTFGLWGMLQISLKVIFPDIKVSTPKRLKGLLLCGYVANFIALIFFGATFNILTLIFILSLLVATHFTYISRGYLWQST